MVDKSPALELAEECRRLGAHLLTGDAANPEVLLGAQIRRAGLLIALCPEDSTNCEIAAVARRLRSGAPEGTAALECRIQVSDTEARRTLDGLLGRAAGPGVILPRFFDCFDPEARQLLIHDLPLDHDGIRPGDKREVHLVILGFGRMGRALAVRAAQLGVFAEPGRLRISVIDRKAGLHEKELLFHHPQYREVCDIEFHELEVISPEALKLVRSWCGRPEAVTSLAVCFDQEQRALEIATRLGPLLRSGRVRVAVRFAGQSGLARLIQGSGFAEGGRPRFVPFGMDERVAGACYPDAEPVDQFARAIHQAYTRIREAEAGGDASKREALAGDDSTRPWDDLSEDFRESSRQMADHIFIKLRSLGFEAVPLTDGRPAVSSLTGGQIEALAEMEHRRWVAERLIAGWRQAPGPKNLEERTNPNLVAWNKLTSAIQDYDRKLVALIPELLGGAGKKIVASAGVFAKETLFPK